jgi:transposase-like protein
MPEDQALLVFTNYCDRNTCSCRRLVVIFSGRASFSIILATEPIIEQDHRFIKKVTKPIMGFKALRFKSHHWFGYFFDKAMVLFDNII